MLYVILDFMEIEYDKLVLCVIFVVMFLCFEFYELGLKFDVVIKNLERVLVVFKEVENVVFVGKDMIVLVLKEKVMKWEKYMVELNFLIEKLWDIWVNSRYIKIMEEKIIVCSESFKSL